MKKVKTVMIAVLAIALVAMQVPAFIQAEMADPAPKLLAEYTFDNSSTEDSAGNHDATLYNNVDVVQGTYIDGGNGGKALQLSQMDTGEKLWLSVPYEIFDGTTDSFSISLRYRASGYNTSGEDSQLFSLYNSSAEKFLFYSYAAVGFQDKGFVMKWDGTYGYANIIGAPYEEGEWVDLVFCVKADGDRSVITVYKNGVPVSEVDQGGEWGNSLMSTLGIDTFTIGGKNPYKGGSTPSCLFYGAIDDVRVYAGALTADEVAAIGKPSQPTESTDTTISTESTDTTISTESTNTTISTESTGTNKPTADPSSKLIAEFNFDNDNTRDALGRHDAVLYNDGDVARGTYIDGKFGKALQLSQKNTGDKLWLSVPYEVFDGTADSFSLSLWFKADGYNTSGEDSELFSFYNSGAEKFLFYSYAAKDFQDKGFTMKWDGNYGYANLIGMPYEENEWVHLIFCVEADGDQSIITAYRNGVALEVDQGGDWSNSLMSSLGIDTFTIGGKNPYKGGDTPSCLFYGAVDEVRLYKGVLTAEEAAAIANSNAGGFDPVNPGPTNPSPETGDRAAAWWLCGLALAAGAAVISLAFRRRTSVNS